MPPDHDWLMFLCPPYLGGWGGGIEQFQGRRVGQKIPGFCVCVWGGGGVPQQKPEFQGGSRKILDFFLGGGPEKFWNSGKTPEFQNTGTPEFRFYCRVAVKLKFWKPRMPEFFSRIPEFFHWTTPPKKSRIFLDPPPPGIPEFFWWNTPPPLQQKRIILTHPFATHPPVKGAGPLATSEPIGHISGLLLLGLVCQTRHHTSLHLFLHLFFLWPPQCCPREAIQLLQGRGRAATSKISMAVEPSLQAEPRAY